MIEKEKALDSFDWIRKSLTGYKNFSMSDINKALETAETAYLEAVKEIEVYKKSRELYIAGDCVAVPCPNPELACFDCYIKQARKEIEEAK
jgi:hypothetical protein